MERKPLAHIELNSTVKKRNRKLRSQRKTFPGRPTTITYTHQGRKEEDAAAAAAAVPCLVDLDIQNITVHYYMYTIYVMLLVDDVQKRKRYGTSSISDS